MRLSSHKQVLVFEVTTFKCSIGLNAFTLCSWEGKEKGRFWMEQAHVLFTEPKYLNVSKLCTCSADQELRYPLWDINY